MGDPTTPLDRGTSFTSREVPRWLEALVLFAAVASIVAAHGPLIGYKTFANVDEAYAAALGERLLEGFRLYHGAVSQRGPLMYYAFEAIGWLHGWDNIVALRVWALGFALAHVALVYWAGRVLLSRRAAVVAAGLTGYALAFGFPPMDGFAINGESLQLPALMAGTVLGALAMRRAPGSRARRGGLVLAGLAFGVACTIKQSVALHPLPLVVWIVYDAHRRKAALAEAAFETALLGAATLFVPALFVVHAWAEGTLREMIYYSVTYNRDVHLNPTTKHFTWLPNLYGRLVDQTLFFVAGALLAGLAAPHLLARVRSSIRRRSGWALVRGVGIRGYLGANLVLALLSASSMFRFFPHYYVQAWPFVALLLGAASDRWLRERRSRAPARAVLVAMAMLLLACGGVVCFFTERPDGRVAHDRTVQDVAKFIEATTAPDDRIFVWGFSPWIYEYAHRRPAGRYVFSTYVTGFVPWFSEKPDVEKARIVPGSVEALLGDLDREKPEVVVDAGSVMMARSMRVYDAPNAWLHQHYCFELRLGAFDVYRHKTDGGALCPSFAFPLAHDAVDWFGHSLGPTRRTVDFDRSLRLPRGRFDRPLWFPEEPRPRGLAALRDARRDKDDAEASADGFAVEEDERESE